MVDSLILKSPKGSADLSVLPSAESVKSLFRFWKNHCTVCSPGLSALPVCRLTRHEDPQNFLAGLILALNIQREHPVDHAYPN